MMKYTAKTAAAVCNRLLKAARKTPRELFHDAWTDKTGRCCLSDGFRAYRLSSCPDGLNADRPAPLVCGNPFDLDKSAFSSLDTGDVVEMPAPDVNAVKTFIAAEKQKPGANMVYDLGAEFPSVNALYLLDMLRLFPCAKWYVDPDPYARMIRPVFAVCDEGSAALFPVRVASKPCKPRETPSDFLQTEYKYFIYGRLPGDSRFRLADVGRGAIGVKKLCAPRYQEQHLDRIKDMLDDCAAQNPGVDFQLRTLDGRRTVYTAVPIFTPEGFAARYTA